MRLDQEGKRRRVVDLGGVEGYITRWSQDCSGCTERGEMRNVVFCKESTPDTLRAGYPALSCIS